MKNSPFTPIIVAIAFSANATLTLPSLAEADETFFCGTSDGVPATLARTSEGIEPIILWNSPYLGESDSTPEELCEKVSQQFQTNDSNGQLNYITTGRRNRKTMACIADIEGGACREFLFTLRADLKPRTALQRLLEIRIESDGSTTETGTPVYVSVERRLNNEYPTK